MRHTRIQQAKPERSFAERIVAVIVAIAMLGGMGYATSAALAEDTPATVETTTDQSATTANESTDGKNATDGTDADNAGDAVTGTADTESDTNTGADAGVNMANAANVGDAASSDANSQTDTTAQSNPQTVNAEQNTVTAKPDPLGVPEHHKTIAKKTGDNDTYTLNLNVTGKRSSTSQTVSQPVDIALVLDNSGSMAYCMNGHQPSFFDPCGGDNVVRSAALKTAVTAFLDGVDTQNNTTIANADNKVQVSLVSFADSASTLSELTSGVTKLKTKVNDLEPQGATNTAAGFNKAKSTLDKDTRTNAIKYVVFFTDGVPTKSDTFSSTVANQTLTTAKQLKDAKVGVYSVGIFSGADASVTSYGWRTNTETRKANVFMNAVSSNYPNYGSIAWDRSGVTLSGGSNKGYYKTASTASELSKVFEDIQQTITTTNGYTGVTIQDTLSEYAEFADAKPAETAKVVTNDGANVTAGWNINVSGKTITASPKSTEPLPNGVTYTLQFDIKPTQKAYDDYAASKNDGKDGYNGIGSADSDAAGNATSAGKPGFYTNDSACLAYSGDGETHDCSDTPYTEHPVDQVKTGAITVQKKWVDADGKASSEGNPESVTFTLQIDGKDSKREAVATAGTEWKASFENLAPGHHTYKVIEKAVEGYETFYESQDVAITADELWKAKPDANTADNVKKWTVTVTNTHKKSTLAEDSIKVSKSISGRKWKKGDSFNFTIIGTDPTPNAPLPDDPASVAIGTNTANHEASFNKIEYKTAGTYTYTVKETKPTNAIVGLHYSQAEYTVTVTVPADMGTPTVSIKQVKDDNGKPVDNQSANVAKFTNTYVAVSALPLTGGMTDRQWLFVGGAVGGLAVLLIGAAGVWNGKKRLV